MCDLQLSKHRFFHVTSYSGKFHFIPYPCRTGPTNRMLVSLHVIRSQKGTTIQPVNKWRVVSTWITRYLWLSVLELQLQINRFLKLRSNKHCIAITSSKQYTLNRVTAGLSRHVLFKFYLFFGLTSAINLQTSVLYRRKLLVQHIGIQTQLMGVLWPVVKQIQESLQKSQQEQMTGILGT